MSPRALVDANVFVHALGTDPLLRPACEAVIGHLASARIRGEAPALMVEEVVHVRHRRSGNRAAGVADGRAARSVLAALHPVGEAELADALEVFLAHERLHARDAIYVAVAQRRGLATMLSTDRGFDRIEGLQRIDPADRGAVDQLARLDLGQP